MWRNCWRMGKRRHSATSTPSRMRSPGSGGRSQGYTRVDDRHPRYLRIVPRREAWPDYYGEIGALRKNKRGGRPRKQAD